MRFVRIGHTVPFVHLLVASALLFGKHICRDTKKITKAYAHFGNAVDGAKRLHSIISANYSSQLELVDALEWGKVFP